MKYIYLNQLSSTENNITLARSSYGVQKIILRLREPIIEYRNVYYIYETQTSSVEKGSRLAKMSASIFLMTVKKSP